LARKLVLLAWLIACPAAAQNYDPEIQRAFLEGVRQLDAGNYDAAAGIFRALLQRTSSPRIKLELARTLFLQKRYREARVLFDEVRLDPEVPWQVRDNVEPFIAAIERAEGLVKFSASVAYDSNPRNMSSQKEFTISGAQLTFVPPADNKPVYGLRYLVQASSPALADDISAYFTGSYLDYPGNSLDRLTIDAGAIKELPTARSSLKAGVEAGTFGDKRLYNFPYVGAFHVISEGAAHRLGGDVKFGYVRFPHSAFLDAVYRSVSLSALGDLSGTAVSLNGALESSTAAERPYSYHGVSGGPGLAWLLPEPAMLLRGDLSLSRRRYADSDPLFGERRVDYRRRFELSTMSKQWRLMNQRPVLSLSFEKNRSSIAFYEYRKVNVSVTLQ
jgi:hypothetical protein